MKRPEDKSLLEGTSPTEADAQLRELIYSYVMNETHPERHGVIRRLYELWDERNAEHFGGLMTVPLILLDEPGQTRCYGQCSTVSGFGCSSQIQLRPSILDGTLRDLRRGTKDPEGLRRFLEDVLLHEMIHQWQQEVTGEHDTSYSGHGPAFSYKANEIGEKLSLPGVGRTCKKRDQKGGEKSPSQWPHNVRPDGYYHGAYVPSSMDKEENRHRRGVFVPIDILREYLSARQVEELCQRLKA